MDYATIEDLRVLWREMTEKEEKRASELISIVSSSLRTEAKKVGKDLDALTSEDIDLKNVAKSVTVDVVARALMTSTNQEPLSQFSESALGYTQSGTFLVPGGGLFIKKSELKRLGLTRQKLGVINIYD